MRIAFVGKGGSGKTTLASLTARHLAAQNLPVLCIDADINQHLAESLGWSPAEAADFKPMGNEITRIKNYLRGANQRIAADEDMIKTTPPGRGSRLIPFADANPLYGYFERERGGVRLMAVGPFTEEDLGLKCYHSKTGAVELLLNHLTDGPGQYLLVDMTAGADSFASGLFTKFDLTVLAVEPTLKSVTVYRQYRDYSKNYGINLKVVANKIENPADLDFIRRHVAAEDLLAAVGNSAYVKGLDQGLGGAIEHLEPANRQALKRIQECADRTPRDWGKMYSQMLQFHRLNAESWANAQAGKDLTGQIDPDFDLARAVS
jgi:CO dehydrogenase maturation factor